MSTYSELLKDPRWQKKRLYVLERDQWTCQCCLDKDRTLHVHHTKYFKGNPWECPDEYLLTLCEACHRYEEDLKGDDVLYDLVSGCGITRNQLFILMRHIKFCMSQESDLTPFWQFHEILRRIVPEDQIRAFAKWTVMENINNG